MQENKTTNWMAIWSLILSILSFVCCCAWWMSLVLGATAVILGVIGLRSGNPNQTDAAIAGIVVGATGAVMGLGIAAFRIFLYANLAKESLGAVDSLGRLI